uniref:Uncharacterized protein n=1 Tax=Anguilla anguilla TaxID=7936 RepID=A0A0E9PC78_ANGAN
MSNMDLFKAFINSSIIKIYLTRRHAVQCN